MKKEKRGYELREKHYYVEPKEFKFKHLFIECPIIPQEYNDDLFNDE